MHEWVNRWASVWGLALMALVALDIRRTDPEAG